MIPGEKDLWHGPVMPHGGPGILGIFQQSVPVGFLLKALGVRQHTGHHAAHGVRYCHGGDLSAGEDEIAHGQFLVHARVDEPLVNALVVAADQNQMVILGLQFSGDGLGEGPAAGGHEDGPAGAIGVDNVLPAAEQRVCLHHGPTASAVGVIVHLHLLVGGVGPDLVGADGDIAPLLRPA